MKDNNWNHDNYAEGLLMSSCDDELVKVVNPIKKINKVKEDKQDDTEFNIFGAILPAIVCHE